MADNAAKSVLLGFGRKGDSVRKDGGRWGVRTIHDGKIKWLGRTFEVVPVQRERVDGITGRQYESDPPYDGRLDGLRALFYTYGGGWHADKVFLHSFGSGEDDWPGPNCIDGYFVWEQWEPVNA